MAASSMQAQCLIPTVRWLLSYNALSWDFFVKDGEEES